MSLPSLRPSTAPASRTAEDPAFASSYGIRDTLRFGPHNAKDDLAPLHPVAAIQQNFDIHQDNMRLAMLGLTQGQHAVMRINMERNLAARVWRGPGLPSSRLGLETLLGRDEMIAFEDVLNDPRDSEQSLAIHDAAEARLKL